MSEITALVAQKRDKERCNVYVDGKFVCGITLASAMQYRLKVGQSIDGETLKKIQFESEKDTALSKALTHVSGSAKTERQIRDFLKGKGYLERVENYVVAKMKEYGFIDDKEYAKEYVGFAVQKKGKRLIKAELKRKGLSDEATDEAIGLLTKEDEESAATKEAEKYFRGKDVTDEKVLLKGYRHLLSKGFEYDVAKTALKSVCGKEVED